MKRFFYWLNIINWLIMLGLIGSIASIINGQNLEQYKETLYSYFHKINETLSVEASFSMAKSMAISFAMVLVLVLLCILIANFLLNRDRYLIAAAVLLFLAGLITFVGTQGILSFNALFFWVSMGFCLYHRQNITSQVEFNSEVN